MTRGQSNRKEGRKDTKKNQPELAWQPTQGNPSTKEARQEDCCMIQASLSYTVTETQEREGGGRKQGPNSCEPDLLNTHL